MEKSVVVITSAHLASDVRIYEKESRSLTKLYDVTLIAPIHDSFVPEDVSYIPLKLFQSRIKRFFNVIKCFFLVMQIRPHIIHIHDPELLPIALLLRWMFRIKIVYDVHENQYKGIPNKEWVPFWFRKIFLFFFSKFESISLRWINGIVLAEYSYSQTYNGKNSNIQVVRNYPIVDDDLLKSFQNVREERDEFILGYVGAIQKERGIFEMIELVRELNNLSSKKFTLEIMGSFASDVLKEHVTGLLEQYEIKNSVIFHGRLTYREFLVILSRADIGLVFLHPTPANMEIIPTKIYEYMMLKIPVIVMDIPILRDFIQYVGCGIVTDAFDPKETAKKVIDLIGDPVMKRKMGMNGYASIKENYNWGHEENKLFQLYSNL